MSLSRARWAALLCSLWLSAGAVAAPRFKLVAYYLASGTPARYVAPDTLPADKLTHLNYAFADIRDGEIVVGDPSLDIGGAHNFARLRRLKQHHPALKTLISVGGWAWSGHFSDAALTPGSRERFAASGVAFIRAHGFDGIDIDWEFPVAGGMPANARRPEDKHNFTLLLRELREQLDRAGRADHRRYLLTAAVGNSAAYLSHIEPKQVAATLDWLNLMAYDMNGTWSQVTGHVSPLYRDPAMTLPDADPANDVADLVERYLAAGVPARKMLLGVPFYGYAWAQCPDARHGEYQPCGGLGRGSWEPGAYDASEIQTQMVDRNGYVRHWNEAAKVPFLYRAENGEFVTYEDQESLRAKLRFLRRRGLGGAMFWEITGDRRQLLLDTLAHDLLPAAARH
ncbi:MAG TPA: glycoside hydrolase family 18 protein [Albitalea sp.]|nr:glycoside hydrolase family 18 protein [Albitalea sp.]